MRFTKVFGSVLVAALMLMPMIPAWGGTPILEVESVAPLPVAVSVATDERTPLPVVVQQSKGIIRGTVSLVQKADDLSDAIRFFWRTADGSRFFDIPEGHALFITDILVSWSDFSPPSSDDVFDLTFVAINNGFTSFSRAWALGGRVLPYSHSFTTPLVFLPAQDLMEALGVMRNSDGRLEVTLTGYLEPLRN